MKPLICALGAP